MAFRLNLGLQATFARACYVRVSNWFFFFFLFFFLLLSLPLHILEREAYGKTTPKDIIFAYWVTISK